MTTQKPGVETTYLNLPREIHTAPLRTTEPLAQGLPWVIEFRVVGTASTIQMQLREHMVIGRTDPAHSVFPEIDLSPYEAHLRGVSRQHAEIRTTENRVTLTDLGSTNGTRVNQYTLKPNEPFRLRHGDEIEIGQLQLQVSFAVVPTHNEEAGDSTQPARPLVEIPILGTGQHIVVVEDDSDVAAVYRMALEYSGFRVTVLTNATTALGLITSQVPDAMILDLMLPDMNGLDLIRFARKQPSSKRVPVIVVSGATGGYRQSQAMEAGADTFLGKPVGVDELVRAVSSLVITNPAAT